MTQSIRVVAISKDVQWRATIKDIFADIQDWDLVSAVSSFNLILNRIESDSVDLFLFDSETMSVREITVIYQQYPLLNGVLICNEQVDNADYIIRALEIGVITSLPKLKSDYSSLELQGFKIQLATVKGQVYNRQNFNISSSKKIRDEISRIEADSFESTTIDLIDKIDVLVIASSTGGPKALTEFIPKLSEKIDVPVLVVQHMPALLTASLAKNLNHKSSLLVKEAANNELICKNSVYIAPGGRHMVVKRGSDSQLYIGLNDEPPENSVRPAADVLFRSVAKCYHSRVLAVVMTGMGADGCRGAATLKEKGAYIVTQDKDSCVVYGMPKAVDDAGLSDERIPLDVMAYRVNGLLKGKNDE